MPENFKHECERNKEKYDIFLHTECGWMIRDEWEDVAIIIEFCPFCGKNLNE